VGGVRGGTHAQPLRPLQPGDQVRPAPRARAPAGRGPPGHRTPRAPRAGADAAPRRDRNKDQSYFLFALDAARLDRVLFPVGELTKTEVRERARALGLPNAERTESQDACFGLGGEGFAEALRRRFDQPARPGAIVDRSGSVLGRHAGSTATRWGSAKARPGAASAVYVLAIDAARAEVVVGSGGPDLQTTVLEAERVNWLIPPACPVFEAEAQIRYRSPPARASVEVLAEGRLRLRFAEPQRAVTPGQAAVLYEESDCSAGMDRAGPGRARGRQRMSDVSEVREARYARQIGWRSSGSRAAPPGQSAVLVLGCGALGSNLASLLARAGVGRLRLVDRDLLELGNSRGRCSTTRRR